MTEIGRLKGPLGPDRVSLAPLCPFLGGDPEPDIHDGGDVWVFPDLVARAHGL